MKKNSLKAKIKRMSENDKQLEEKRNRLIKEGKLSPPAVWKIK